MSSTQEFVVRVPREINKKFNVMRFGSALNVDPSKWKSCQMVRENEFKDVKQENDSEFKEFGAGSEFGKRQREESKRKKYTKKPTSGQQQPWVLKLGGKQPKKYKGIREGGVSENASYYVFFQAPDGAFEAFPVKEWYNFTPIQRYKALTAEEAEEKFEKRDKILNYFSVMINKKRKEEEVGEHSGESKANVKKELKVSDMDDWHDLDSDNEQDLEDRSDDIKPKIKKEKKGLKPKRKTKKKKGSDSDDDESEPQEESDEGDNDDKEVDYMSDLSESSEESETEKNDRSLKGVEDEDALRQLVLSEDEEEEEDKEEEDKNAKDGERPQNADKTNSEDKKVKVKSEKLTANFDSPPPSSSDSDSDDSNVDESKSALLVPNSKIKSKIDSDKSATSSRAATPTSNIDSSTSAVGNGSSNDNKLKRKLVTNDLQTLKKPKLSNDNSDGITEEAVRRYLMRKPMTCTDLLQKFKNKVSFKGDLVHTIAQILKRLNPEKQTIKNKLYFSLKPT